MALLVLGGCAHGGGEVPVSPAFAEAVDCVVRTMAAGGYLETDRRWVLRNTDNRGGIVQRDPAHPEPNTDHLQIAYGSTHIRVYGTQPEEPILVSVGPILSGDKLARTLAAVREDCNP
jgi:hypothetical protein